MRVECEACGELVTASVAIDGAAVRVTCAACRHEMRPAVDASAAQSDVRPCPKCGAAVRGVACVACGLAVERMAAFRDARDGARAVPEAVASAWSRATEGWGEQARHDALLSEVATHRAYAWAAGRYRTRGDDAIAVRQLDRLRRAAAAALLAGATVRDTATPTPYRATWTVLGVLVVVIVAGLAYAMLAHDRVVAGAGARTAAPTGSPRPLTPGHPVSPSTIK